MCEHASLWNRGFKKEKKEWEEGGGTCATLRMLLLKVYLANSIWIMVENEICQDSADPFMAEIRSAE